MSEKACALSHISSWYGVHNSLCDMVLGFVKRNKFASMPLLHIVPYSSQIGIPTCLWYCTGYILSLLNGAKYLIKSLPVVGPVDSWIGLKMTSNWDNAYGHRIGVGSVTKPTIDKKLIPSQKDLCAVMKFRVFASLIPLCSQKLKWSLSSCSKDQQRGTRWRNRDTDVTYSGRQ